MSLVGIFVAFIFLIFVIAFRVSSGRIDGRFPPRRLGTAVFALGLIAFITMAFFYGCLLLGQAVAFPVYYLSAMGQFLLSLQTIGAISVDLTLVSTGIFLMVHRRLYSDSELWLIAGLIYVMAGISGLAYPIIFEFPSTTVVAGIVGATCFLSGGATQKT